MEWLTHKQVQAAAKKGHIEAIRCSLKHWRQLLSATERELSAGLRNIEDLLYGPSCALCYRYFDGGEDALKVERGCGECPLRLPTRKYGCNCDSLWDKAQFFAWEWYGDRTPANWIAWKEAAKAMKVALFQALAKANLAQAKKKVKK